MKQKNAASYYKYWRTKALANKKDMKKFLVCFDHMMYWLDKVLHYNAAIHKKLES